MNIIVTGGSGYLGTHVRRRLKADNLARREGFDIRKPSGLDLLSRYDAVVHMAACLDKRPAAVDRCFAVNAQGTLNILKSLHAGQAFVFVSTKDVYGDHSLRRRTVNETCPTSYTGQSAYEWSKLIAEKYVEYYSHRLHLRTAILRLSTTYAPATAGNSGTFVNYFVEAIKKGAPIRLTSRGRQVRDLLHVKDLAAVIQRFLNSSVSGGIFNIGGGPENVTTLAGLVRSLSDMIGTEPVLELSPEKESGQMRYVSDIRKAFRILGWAPNMSLEQGLKTILR